MAEDSEPEAVSGIDQKRTRRARPAADAALAVSAAHLHELLEAAEKHAAKDPALAAAIAHFQG